MNKVKIICPKCKEIVSVEYRTVGLGHGATDEALSIGRDSRMTYTEALSKLLTEHERQVKDPELWQDNPWKQTYYGLLNKVYDKLREEIK